jgi:UDP-N-acetylmuramoyl-tripeptide--D-alanyl-D-alanine ligase
VAVLGSRPTPLPTIVVEDAQAALQALAAHVVARLRDRLAVAGLTGSQGKTSTKDLLAAVLSSTAPTTATIGSLNNELGVPLTMLRADAATRFLVLEMGARHIGDIAGLTGLAAPDIAVVLNVGQAHLGKFGSSGAIAKAKGELVQGLAPGGTAPLSQVLADYGGIGQQRWEAWRRRQRLDDRLPGQFSELVTAVAAFADTATTGIAAGKSWDPATGGWS